VEKGTLDMGHARALLAIEGLQQSEIANHIVSRSLSVRETEKLINQWLNKENQIVNVKRTDPDVSRLEKDLSDKLAAKVWIQHQDKGKGKLVIHYNSLNELSGI